MEVGWGTALPCCFVYSSVAGTKVLLQCVLVCGVSVGFCHVPPLRPSPSSNPTCLTHVPPSPSVLAARGTGRVRRVEGRASAGRHVKAAGVHEGGCDAALLM